jgi:hypothetical protein
MDGSSSNLLLKVANFLEKLGESRKIVNSDSILEYVYMHVNNSAFVEKDQTSWI